MKKKQLERLKKDFNIKKYNNSGKRSYCKGRGMLITEFEDFCYEKDVSIGINVNRLKKTNMF